MKLTIVESMMEKDQYKEDLGDEIESGSRRLPIFRIIDSLESAEFVFKPPQ